MYGAATGADGIGGASILASETFDATGPAKRPSVQVGDPFMEKLLIECTLELIAAKIITGIQDFGAAGISCATSELSAAGDGGMRVDLDKVPLRDSSLSPEEILMSESQERMMAVVAPTDIVRFFEICRKWDVAAAIIGEVSRDDRLVITWRGETIVDVDPKTVAHEGPVYSRPMPARPTSTTSAHEREPPHATGTSSGALLAVAQPNGATRPGSPSVRPLRPRQPVLAQPDDAGCCGSTSRPTSASRWPPTATGVLPADPYAGAQLALAEAYRNVAVPGATAGHHRLPQLRLAEDPAIMWQFREAIRGLVDGCAALGPRSPRATSASTTRPERADLPTPIVGCSA